MYSPVDEELWHTSTYSEKVSRLEQIYRVPPSLKTRIDPSTGQNLRSQLAEWRLQVSNLWTKNSDDSTSKDDDPDAETSTLTVGLLCFFTGYWLGCSAEQ